ncbi:MAG: nuclear transport factor 2 family protein [Ilumatobacteraceae bacterium]
MTVSDEQAIHNLIHRYAGLMDSADFPGIARLFAAAVLTNDQDTEGMHGVEAITRVYTDANRVYDDGKTHTKHVISNTELDIDGETARASSYFMVFQQIDDFPLQPIVSGRYGDSFERVDGTWRFNGRHLSIDLVGDLSRHLRQPLDDALRGED